MDKIVLKQFWISIKYAFLKTRGWRELWHAGDLSRERHDIYLYGKKYKDVKIRGFESGEDFGISHQIELPDGIIFNVQSSDMSLFLPWHKTAQGKAQEKRIRKLSKVQ